MSGLFRRSGGGSSVYSGRMLGLYCLLCRALRVEVLPWSWLQTFDFENLESCGLQTEADRVHDRIGVITGSPKFINFVLTEILVIESFKRAMHPVPIEAAVLVAEAQPMSEIVYDGTKVEYSFIDKVARL